MPEIAERYAQKTRRLKAKQCRIGFEVGGKLGELILGVVDMETSRNSLLRMVKATKSESRPVPRVLGVDDWAVLSLDTGCTSERVTPLCPFCQKFDE